MMPEGKFNIMPERDGSGDPSMPQFKFTGEEREQQMAKFRAEGVPEDQLSEALRALENIITNKQVQAKLEQEMGRV